MTVRPESAPPVRLVDYRPPAWLVETVDLDISLDANDTRVRAALAVVPNPAVEQPVPLVLDGDELELVSLRIDGHLLGREHYTLTPTRLTIPSLPARRLVVTIETRINPSENTKLMGLYRSNGVFCTQCEAEGFRRITFFPDRPDVLAVYTTRIEADAAEAPVLLGNGNPIASGPAAVAGRHFAIWHDPFPKPSYLFALVGGKLAKVGKPFVTMSGRPVDLAIYVEEGKQDRCAYALDALERSMRWDETAFGREYDLDVFNIVAVSDFNMGAMENKGLNIFNDKYILATPDTATDADYANIEGIIAHEYFHNWSGNRITCRDWFQLCLKEGLTVFRDQEFSADMRSRAVKRITDVRVLKAHQFAEDGGPLAHAVRPAVYHEINNFYTATVYEKGAEVVRMLKTLLGAETFRAGMDLYFTRHDGEAATVEQFLACFAEVSGRDLGQFKLWYEQAGTPEVAVYGYYDAKAKTYRLDVVQALGPTPGQPSKRPMLIPLAIGLVNGEGQDLPLMLEGGERCNGVLEISKSSESRTFVGISTAPKASINRGFSAPIRLTSNSTAEDLAFLAAHDSDGFNRWQSLTMFASRQLVIATGQAREGKAPDFPDSLIAAFARMLADETLEPAFAAQALLLPGEADIAREIGSQVDPDAIFAARKALRQRLGGQLAEATMTRHRALDPGPGYSPDAASAGARGLRNVLLDLMVAGGSADAISQAQRQFADADNMTDRMAALSALTLAGEACRQQPLAAFYAQYAANPLVIDKWFALQAAIPEAETLERVRGLMGHPSFALSNPNRVRALIGSFAAGNQTQFNRADGAGYDFLAGIVLELDQTNPQVAARLLGSFKSWRALESRRSAKAQAALERIAAASNLSPDVADIVNRALG